LIETIAIAIFSRHPTSFSFSSFMSLFYHGRR
jgi:hypothetical protein